MGRSIRTRLTLLKIDIKGYVNDNQYKKSFAGKRKLRNFDGGEKVNIRNYRGEEKWKTAEIVDRSGPFNVRC